MKAIIITGGLILGAMILLGLAGCSQTTHWSGGMDRPTALTQELPNA